MAWRHPQHYWTKAQDDKLRDMSYNSYTDTEIGHKLGRTGQAVALRRLALGIKKRNKLRFTPEDIESIKEQYARNVPIGEIAASVGRTVGALRQRIFHLGITRDGRKTRLATKFGVEVLQLSDDPLEIQQILYKQQKEEKEKREREQKAKVDQALAAMLQALSEGVPRKEAFRAAMIAGATLQQVGDTQGITRERVRQIVYKATATGTDAHEAECKGCGVTFTRTFRQQRYCTALCRIESWRSVHHPRADLGPRNCLVCGTEYFPSHGNAKYCGPACAIESQRQANTSRVAKYRRRLREKALPAPANCERCGLRYQPVTAEQRLCEACIGGVTAEWAARKDAVDKMMTDMGGPNINELIDALPEERQKKVLSRAKSIKQKVKPSRPTLRRYLT